MTYLFFIFFFNIPLTLQLSITLANDQLDAQIFNTLLQSSTFTCFEQYLAHPLLLLQSALQPLVGFGLLYDFVPQSSTFALLSPVYLAHPQEVKLY